jgi:hypothetical protein
MPAQDALLAIAQISVALIGFSGLISVFSARAPVGLKPRDFSGLAMILASGAIPFIFALLPFPLHYLGLSESSVWGTCSAALALVAFLAAVIVAVVNRRLTLAGHPQRTPRTNRATQLCAGSLSGALALSALDVVLPRGPGIYLLALLVFLVLCLYFVVLLVLVQRESP